MTRREGGPSGRYSRGAAVAVLVGDGLDTAAPRHADVAVEEAEVDTNHGHGCAWCFPPACDYQRRPSELLLLLLLRAPGSSPVSSPTAEHRPPTGGCSPLRRRAAPAGREPARRRRRLRHFPAALGPSRLRAPRLPERSGKGREDGVI